MDDRHFPLGRVARGQVVPSVPLGKCPPVVHYTAPAPGSCRGCRRMFEFRHPSASSCAGCRKSRLARLDLDYCCRAVPIPRANYIRWCPGGKGFARQTAGTKCSQKAYWHRCPSSNPERLSSPMPPGKPKFSPHCCRGLKSALCREGGKETSGWPRNVSGMLHAGAPEVPCWPPPAKTKKKKPTTTARVVACRQHTNLTSCRPTDQKENASMRQCTEKLKPTRWPLCTVPCD